MPPKMLVIIPTYNERENIERLINEIISLPQQFDLLVVDDNSPDGTSAIVKTIAEKNTRVHLISRTGKLGLGTAYIAGFSWALAREYDFVFSMDADFSHQPHYLPELARMLQNHDLVIGSRYVQGGGIEGWPLPRRLLSRMGNIYARTIAGLPIRDCTSGFMAIKRSILEEFVSKNILADGYSFLIELKNLAFRSGYSLGELPITFVDRKAGESKISKKIIFEALGLVIKLRIKSLFAPKIRGNAIFKVMDRYAGIPLIWFLGLFTGHGKAFPEEFKSILVIKLSAIGDTVLLIPALRALRKRYPSARITAVCTGINKNIFEACPYVNETVVLDMKRIFTTPWKIARTLRKREPEIALEFDQWLRLSPLLVFASGAKYRLGFKTQGQGKHFLFTHYIEHQRKRHEIGCFLDIVRLLGISGEETALEFWLNDAPKKKADETLRSLGVNPDAPFLVFHPETPAHGIQRQWPIENYRELGKQLRARFHYPIIISGTKKDRISNSGIVTAFPQGVYLLPPLTIMEFAAVLAKAQLLVCGNTGIMHLACAVQTPVVALHGPTDPLKWGPWGERSVAVRSKLKCSPCLYLGFEYGCKTRKCMEAITVSEVEKAAQESLQFSE